MASNSLTSIPSKHCLDQQRSQLPRVFLEMITVDEKELLEVLNRVVKELQNLSADERDRVVKTVMIFYGIR